MKETGAQIRSPLVEIAHCSFTATDPCPPAPGHVVTHLRARRVGRTASALSWPYGLAVACPWLK